MNYPQPTAEEKEKLESYDAKRAAKAAKGKGGKGGRGGRGRGRGRGVNAHQTAEDADAEEEEEMCTAEQMKALRVELGLSVHSLNAAGEMNPAGREDDQWQCVRVQRAFAGMGEQPSIRCHRAIETALGFAVDPDSSPMIESELERILYDCGAEESIGALSMAGIQTVTEAAEYCPAEMQKAMEESAGIEISLAMCMKIVHGARQLKDSGWSRRQRPWNLSQATLEPRQRPWNHCQRPWNHCGLWKKRMESAMISRRAQRCII